MCISTQMDNLFRPLEMDKVYMHQVNMEDLVLKIAHISRGVYKVTWTIFIIEKKKRKGNG